MAAPTTVSIPHQLGRAEVTMEIQLPGVLGMITSGLKIASARLDSCC
jgi:hypothetical protein